MDDIPKLDLTVDIGNLQLAKPGDFVRLASLDSHFKVLSDRLYDDAIMTPGQLLGWDRRTKPLRERKPPYRPLKSSVVFVFGKGEDLADRATTRLGGLAYWPAKLPWPTGKNSQPLDFLWQLDFRGITWPEKLPGDLLTIHAKEESDEWEGTGDSDDYRLNWITVSAEEKLISRAEQAKLGNTLGPFYSVKVAYDELKLYAGELFRGEEIDGHLHHLAATKIGGYSPIFPDNAAEVLKDIKDPVYLCSIVSLDQDFCKVEDAWLPAKKPLAREPGGVTTAVMSTLTLLYPKGHPERLHWILYLP